MSVCELYDEKRLFAHIAMGDEAAFRVLFDRYRTRIYAIAFKLTKSTSVAEEIVQEVFLAIWLNKEKFEDVKDTSAYIFSMAYHKVFFYLKKASREAILLETIIATMQQGVNNTEETVAANESRWIIDKAVQQLPPQRQTIYRLSRQDGLSHEEIAHQLNISRNTVKNQLVQALRYIRVCLQKGALFLLWFLQD